MIALNVTNDSQKLALLLNYVGEECYDTYDNLLIRRTQESYSNAIRLFDGRFKPKSNISCEIETISKFFIRVKQQAVKCHFGENLNNEIKKQKFSLVLVINFVDIVFETPTLPLKNLRY